MARLLLARLDIDSDGPGGTTKKFFLLNKNDPRRDGARPSLADIQFSGMDPRSKQIYMRPLKKTRKFSLSIEEELARRTSCLKRLSAKRACPVIVDRRVQ